MDNTCPVLTQAKEVLLLAFGENKTSTVAKAVEGPVTPAVPASFLQEHPNVTFYLDGAASAGMDTTPQCCVPQHAGPHRDAHDGTHCLHGNAVDVMHCMSYMTLVLTAKTGKTTPSSRVTLLPT